MAATVLLNSGGDCGVDCVEFAIIVGMIGFQVMIGFTRCRIFLVRAHCIRVLAMRGM